MKKAIALCILTSISLLFFACEKKVEDDLLVTVYGYVYVDSTMTTPAQNVMVRVRTENGEYIPDAVAYTDREGYYSVSFYLGHEYSYNDFCPFYYARVEVQFFHEGFYYIVPDVYVEMGKSYKLPPIHLGLFTEYSGG